MPCVRHKYFLSMGALSKGTPVQKNLSDTHCDIILTILSWRTPLYEDRAQLLLHN